MSTYTMKLKPPGLDAPGDDGMYLEFTVKLGPKFPIKSGFTAQEALDAFRAELTKNAPGTLPYAYLTHVVKCIELQMSAGSGDEYSTRTFDSPYWCHWYGCGSCDPEDADPGNKYYNCSYGEGCVPCYEVQSR